MIGVLCICFLLMLAAMPSIARERSVPSGCGLWAIGDIHGDLNNAKHALRLAGVTNRHNQWKAKCGVLVQTGDILDRGAQSLAALDYFHKLREEAREDGGEVILLVGNHELLNMEGVVGYVHEGELSNHGGEEAWRRLFQPSGRYRVKFEQQDAIAFINGTLFVHAGITPEYAALGVRSMNRMARYHIQHSIWNKGITGDDGVFWTRTVILDAMKRRCDGLQRSLESLNAKRMVVGHTIQESGKIMKYCDGRLIAIDIGMSSAIYNHVGMVQFLENGAVKAYYEINE